MFPLLLVSRPGISIVSVVLIRTFVSAGIPGHVMRARAPVISGVSSAGNVRVSPGLIGVSADVPKSGVILRRDIFFAFTITFTCFDIKRAGYTGSDIFTVIN